MEDAVEAIWPMDVQVPDLDGLGDWFGQRVQRCGVGQGPVRAVSIVERFELAQRMEQMALVPNEGAVQ